MKAKSAAFFDVDGTLLKGNIVRYYAGLRLLGLSGLRRTLWLAAFLATVPYYVLLDKISRRRFAAAFYRNYRKIAPEDLEKRIGVFFKEQIEPHIYPEAEETIELHRKQGRELVLVTGSLEPIVTPLAKRLNVTEVICCRLVQRAGKFTGELQGGPLTDREKAEAVKAYADRRSLDLAECYAYADSMDDIPMLLAVGHPRVVNPKGRLGKVADKRRWPVLLWGKGDRSR